MSYNIVRSDKAHDQLMEAIEYIALDSGSKETALNYLQKIEKAVMYLAEQPHIGSYPRYSILKKQGYRVLIVERHLLFYKVDEAKQVITIHAIVDGRQNYRSLV